MTEETYAGDVLIKLIGPFSDIQALTTYDGFQVALLSDSTTIRLPALGQRINYETLWTIAEVKLCASNWDFEYFMGELDKPNDRQT